MSKDFRGISFPFRVGNKGGVVMSSVDINKAPHIEESIEQTLGTFRYERPMESHIGCDLDTQIFEPNDVASHNLIKYQIVEALKEHEPRIRVRREDIVLTEKDNYVYAEIPYIVIQYNTSYVYNMRLRGGNDEA